MGKIDTNVVQPDVVTAPKKQSKFVKEFLKNYPLFLMVLPGVILVAIFAYAPMVGLVMAFKDYNLIDGMFGSPWCGLDNFRFLFLDQAPLLIRNTLGYNSVFIVGGMILSVALAIALSELRGTKCKKIYQTIIIMPHFLSIVIVSYLVYAFLNPVAGAVNNSILPALGIVARNPETGNAYAWADWYSIPKIWPYVLIFVNFWKSVGYSSIVYVATIAGIDQEMYEAAVIDGATKWQQIKSITIPMLIPTMIILGTLNVGKIFNADFGLFYQVPRDQGALREVTEVIDTYVYRKRTGNANVGPATAAGLFQSICSFVLVMVTNAIVRKIDPERSLF